MKYKTADLIGRRLDLAVAKAEGLPVHPGPGDFLMETCLDAPPWAHEIYPSSDWRDGGQIIERERIWLFARSEKDEDFEGDGWDAAIGQHLANRGQVCSDGNGFWGAGSTPLIAAMRAYVTSKLGEEVELP